LQAEKPQIKQAMERFDRGGHFVVGIIPAEAVEVTLEAINKHIEATSL